MMPLVKNTSHQHFIPIVLKRTPCNRHHVPLGIPCFHLRIEGGYSPAVCGDRVHEAGYVGKPSAEALMIKSKSKTSKKR